MFGHIWGLRKKLKGTCLHRIYVKVKVGAYLSWSSQEKLHCTQVTRDGGFQAVSLARILIFGQFIVLRKKLKETWRASICSNGFNYRVWIMGLVLPYERDETPFFLLQIFGLFSHKSCEPYYNSKMVASRQDLPFWACFFYTIVSSYLNSFCLYRYFITISQSRIILESLQLFFPNDG